MSVALQDLRNTVSSHTRARTLVSPYDAFVTGNLSFLIAMNASRMFYGQGQNDSGDKFRVLKFAVFYSCNIT